MRSEESLERRREARREWYRKNRERALASNREWKKNNPEKVKASTKRRYEKHRERLLSKRRLEKYGIDQESHDALMAEQGGICAICGSPPKESKSLAVDHDHSTGMVRGLLCDPCNLGIGLLGDSVERLESAVAYINKAAERWQEALEGES